MTREEAILWLTNEKWTNANNKYKKEWNEAFDLAIEALSNRPTDEWCTDCKEYDHEKHCCPRFNRVIRTTLNEAVANLKEEFESAEYEDYEHATLVDIKEPLKVLVVRCKDCRYAMVRTEEEMNKPIKPQPILCEWFCIGVENDDYCSHGERKKTMTREEAIKILRIRKEYATLIKEDVLQEALNMAIEALSNQQKWIDEELQNYLIENADLVTCKDCKHYEFADNRAFGMPTKRCEWTGFEDVDDNDFCSRAERREP